MTLAQIVVLGLIALAIVILLLLFAEAALHKKQWGHWPGEHVAFPSYKKKCKSKY